jgi:asparagine synthase (glutamine-hydrolysing)
VPKFNVWNRRLAATGALRTAAGHLLERLPDPRLRRLGDMLGQDPELSTSYAAFRGIFTRAEARALTGQFVSTAIPDDLSFEPMPIDPTPQDGACRLEMTKYLCNQLLRDTDVMSMACGVEVRVPFIDPLVVSTVTSIPQATRLSPDKALLRRAVPQIPEWVLSQPKRGFMFPMDRWLRGPWADVFADTEARCTVPTETWYRKWCVHAFEVWLDRLREAPAAPDTYSTVVVTRGVHG